jgi:hypothetical protein
LIFNHKIMHRGVRLSGFGGNFTPILEVSHPETASFSYRGMVESVMLANDVWNVALKLWHHPTLYYVHRDKSVIVNRSSLPSDQICLVGCNLGKNLKPSESIFTPDTNIKRSLNVLGVIHD